MTILSNNKKKRTYKLRIQITQEQKILGELLNMIHSYKELAYQDMSVVSRAVFEMRLSRIHFSAGDDFEMGNGYCSPLAPAKRLQTDFLQKNHSSCNVPLYFIVIDLKP